MDNFYDGKKILSFYENCYYFEINRKDTLNSRLNFSIAILTLLIGAVAFYLTNISKLHLELSVISIAFWLFLLCLAITIAFSLYYLYKSIFGFEYGYMPSLNKIDSTIKTINSGVDKQFTSFLLDRYSKATTLNRENNKRKSGYFILTLRSLFVAIIFLICTTIPFFILKIQNGSTIYKIEVMNLKGAIIMQDEEKKEKKKEEEVAKWPDIEKLEEANVKEKKETEEDKNSQ